MSLDGLVVTLHALGGAGFAVTIILMQMVVSPAMAKIPASEQKAEAGAVIASRARLAMDIIIALQSATAIYMLATRWSLIATNPWLAAKALIGGFALTVALLLHFHWRGKKARLKAAGETEKFQALSAWTLKMEKAPLVAAPLAFFMGVIWGHL